MDQIIANTPQKRRYEKPIKILSIISLACITFGCLRCFLYVYNGKIEFFFPSIGGNYELYFFWLWERLFRGLLPCILLFLSVWRFQAGKLEKFVLPIILGIFVFFSCFDLLFYAPFHWSHTYSIGAIFTTWKDYGYYLRFYFWSYLTEFLLYVSQPILLGLSTWFVLKKPASRNVLPLIALCLGCLAKPEYSTPLFEILQNVGWYLQCYFSYLIRDPVEFILIELYTLGFIALCAALCLLLLSKREFSTQTQAKKIAEKVENMPPERALRYLKKQYDRGNISEEEYQARRSKLIQML